MEDTTHCTGVLRNQYLLNAQLSGSPEQLWHDVHKTAAKELVYILVLWSLMRFDPKWTNQLSLTSCPGFQILWSSTSVHRVSSSTSQSKPVPGTIVLVPCTTRKPILLLVQNGNSAIPWRTSNHPDHPPGPESCTGKLFRTLPDPVQAPCGVRVPVPRDAQQYIVLQYIAIYC